MPTAGPVCSIGMGWMRRLSAYEAECAYPAGFLQVREEYWGGAGPRLPLYLYGEPVV